VTWYNAGPPAGPPPSHPPGPPHYPPGVSADWLGPQPSTPYGLPPAPSLRSAHIPGPYPQRTSNSLQACTDHHTQPTVSHLSTPPPHRNLLCHHSDIIRWRMRLPQGFPLQWPTPRRVLHRPLHRRASQNATTRSAFRSETTWYAMRLHCMIVIFNFIFIQMAPLYVLESACVSSWGRKWTRGERGS
jgi:hypothetical protein